MKYSDVQKKNRALCMKYSEDMKRAMHMEYKSTDYLQFEVNGAESALWQSWAVCRLNI